MPGYEEGPGHRYSRPSYIWNWGPKSWHVATSQQRVCWLIRPDVVAMASRRIIATSKKEVFNVISFINCHGCYTTVAQQSFHKQCAFMLSILEVVHPDGDLLLRV
jgi:hypothetical protein